MQINFESDIVELSEDSGEFLLAGKDVPVHQVLADLSSGMTMEEVSEEYDIDEGYIAQLLSDISEAFR